MPRIQRTNRVTPNMVRNEPFVLFGLVPKEVVAKDFSRVKDLLSVLQGCGTDAKGKIALAYDYDHDPREIQDILEIKEYNAEILSMCPHFMYYLVPDVQIVRPFLFTVVGAYTAGIDRTTRMARVAVADPEYCRAKIRELLLAAETYAAGMKDNINELRMAVRAVGLPM